jgi:hypothetical protein
MSNARFHIGEVAGLKFFLRLHQVQFTSEQIQRVSRVIGQTWGRIPEQARRVIAGYLAHAVLKTKTDGAEFVLEDMIHSVAPEEVKTNEAEGCLEIRGYPRFGWVVRQQPAIHLCAPAVALLSDEALAHLVAHELAHFHDFANGRRPHTNEAEREEQEREVNALVKSWGIDDGPWTRESQEVDRRVFGPRDAPPAAAGKGARRSQRKQQEKKKRAAR